MPTLDEDDNMEDNPSTKWQKYSYFKYEEALGNIYGSLDYKTLESQRLLNPNRLFDKEKRILRSKLRGNFNLKIEIMLSDIPITMTFAHEAYGGRLLAVGGGTGDIQILRTPEPYQTREQYLSSDSSLVSHRVHNTSVNDLAFSPPGLNNTDRALYSASCDANVVKFNLDQQKAEWRLKAHNEWIKQIIFQPNSPNIFWTCGSDGHIRCWDERKIKIAAQQILTQSDDPEESLIYDQHIFPLIDLARQHFLYNRSPQRRTVIDSKARSVSGLAFIHADPPILASSGVSDGLVKLWDARKINTKKPIPLLQISATDEISRQFNMENKLNAPKRSRGIGRSRGIISLQSDQNFENLALRTMSGSVYIHKCVNLYYGSILNKEPIIEPNFLKNTSVNDSRPINYLHKPSLSGDGHYIAVQSACGTKVYVHDLWDDTHPMLPIYKIPGDSFSSTLGTPDGNPDFLSVCWGKSNNAGQFVTVSKYGLLSVYQTEFEDTHVISKTKLLGYCKNELTSPLYNEYHYTAHFANKTDASYLPYINENTHIYPPNTHSFDLTDKACLDWCIKDDEIEFPQNFSEFFHSKTSGISPNLHFPIPPHQTTFRTTKFNNTQTPYNLSQSYTQGDEMSQTTDGQLFSKTRRNVNFPNVITHLDDIENSSDYMSVNMEQDHTHKYTKQVDTNKFNSENELLDSYKISLEEYTPQEQSHKPYPTILTSLHTNMHYENSDKDVNMEKWSKNDSSEGDMMFLTPRRRSRNRLSMFNIPATFDDDIENTQLDLATPKLNTEQDMTDLDYEYDPGSPSITPKSHTREENNSFDTKHDQSTDTPYRNKSHTHSTTSDSTKLHTNEEISKHLPKYLSRDSDTPQSGLPYSPSAPLQYELPPINYESTSTPKNSQPVLPSLNSLHKLEQSITLLPLEDSTTYVPSEEDNNNRFDTPFKIDKPFSSGKDTSHTILNTKQDIFDFGFDKEIHTAKGFNFNADEEYDDDQECVVNISPSSSSSAMFNSWKEKPNDDTHNTHPEVIQPEEKIKTTTHKQTFTNSPRWMNMYKDDTENHSSAFNYDIPKTINMNSHVPQDECVDQLLDPIINPNIATPIKKVIPLFFDSFNSPSNSPLNYIGSSPYSFDLPSISQQTQAPIILNKSNTHSTSNNTSYTGNKNDLTFLLTTSNKHEEELPQSQNSCGSSLASFVAPQPFLRPMHHHPTDSEMNDSDKKQ